MEKALLIVGHGSKSKEAVKIFEKIVNVVKEKSKYNHVFGAHMELASPGIEEIVKIIAEKKILQIIIVPYFLYEGNHIKFDIPEIIDKLKIKYPDIVFKFAKPIGFEPLLADILLQRAQEADI